MKATIMVLGIILLIIGIGTLGYQGFTYTSRDKVLEVGNVQVTADTEKSVVIPSYVGVIALVSGVVLVLVGRMNK